MYLSHIFFTREYIVKLKDKGLLYKKLKILGDKNNEEIRTVNWNEEFKKAEEEGKKQVTNNDYMVYDDYYNKYKSTLKSNKDYLKDRNILDSKEYDDFNLYLDICSDLKIKPYVILMPTNGKWYDDLGMKKNERHEFYKTIQKDGRKQRL